MSGGDCPKCGIAMVDVGPPFGVGPISCIYPEDCPMRAPMIDEDREHGPDKPIDDMAKRALCAWNNVAFPNATLEKTWDACAEVTREGWRRVVMVLVEEDGCPND